MTTVITEELRQHLAERLAVQAYGRLARNAVDNIIEAVGGGAEFTRAEIFGTPKTSMLQATMRSASIEGMVQAGVLAARKTHRDGRVREVFRLASGG
jgi:hypothetical protein